MKIKIIRKDKILEFINLLKKDFEVIAPVKTDSGINFDVIKDVNEIVLNFQNTTFPPKKLFLPDSEVLFTYKKNKKIELKVQIEAKKRVIFGIRPCDVNGLLILDKIFKDGLSDPYYLERRKNAVIIALNCNEAKKSCFCDSLGTNILKSGFDLLLTSVGEKYYIEIGSKKGKEIAKRGKKLFEDLKEKVRKPELKFEKKLLTENLEKILTKSFNDEIWEREANKCLSCAACTIVCPTCYCYDVEDIINLATPMGKRIRKWNFCSLKNFTRVAGNIVFRPERAERLKQFVYHKLAYFKERYGVFLCVGCGRCIDRCIAGIDLVKIANELVEKYGKSISS